MKLISGATNFERGVHLEKRDLYRGLASGQSSSRKLDLLPRVKRRIGQNHLAQITQAQNTQQSLEQLPGSNNRPAVMVETIPRLQLNGRVSREVELHNNTSQTLHTLIDSEAGKRMSAARYENNGGS